MAGNDLKINYNAAQRRIRVEFVAETCFMLPEPPAEIFAKARSKMETEITLGNVQQYIVYEERLRETWKVIRTEIKPESATTERFNLTLALGAPKFKNCIVTPPTDEGAAFNLTMKGQPGEIANWNIDWVKLHIQLERRRLNLKGPGNPAQIYAAWLRAGDGIPVTNLPISRKPDMSSATDKPFKVVGNRQRQEATIVVYDHHMLTDKVGLERLLKAGADAARGMGDAAANQPYTFRKAEMTLGLRSAINGPERIGIDMPLLLLVATPGKVIEKTEAASDNSPLAAPQSQRPQANDGAENGPVEARRSFGAEGDTAAVVRPEGARGGAEDPAVATKVARKDEGAKANRPEAARDKAKDGVTTTPEPAARPKTGSTKSYPGKGLLNLIVTDDSMEAMIGDFDTAIYNSSTFAPDKVWLNNEALRYGIVYGISKGNLVKVLDGLARKKNLTGYILAQGSRGSPGKKPFLYPLYKDKQKEARASKSSAEAVNVREVQTAESVMDGDLVAEIRYAIPEVKGRDVFNNELSPPESEQINVKIGEGISERKPGKYYASMDGMPLIEDNSISISSKFIHEGDVNLKTGNIYFDGPAEIHGAIDSGSTVIVTGDLTVYGPIRSAFVRAGGNINAMEGICTTERGRVQAGNDIVAEFVENSNITCGGSLIVQKAVINSQVIVGGAIELNKQSGVLAGGVVSCKLYVRSAKIGFAKGNKTLINVGVDWRVELAVRIRQGRISKLERVNNEDRMALRELIRKKKEQMTARHQELIDKLQIRLQRQRDLLDKCQEHLKSAQSMLTWDKEARIYCHEALSTNVELRVGGNLVPVLNEVAGVLVSTKRRRSSYIIALAEAEMDEAG